MHYFRMLRLAASCRTHPREDPGAAQTRKKTNKGVSRKQFQGFASALITFCLLLQSISPALAATFTAGMAKRDAPGPFAAGVMVQGHSSSNSNPADVVTYGRGTQVNNYFWQNADISQGSVVFWITPEWNGNDGLYHYILDGAGLLVYKSPANTLGIQVGSGIFHTSISTWQAGTTYSVVVRWDSKTPIDGTNYVSASINDTHSYGLTSSWTPTSPLTNIVIGSTSTPIRSANALIEGLTVYRRPLFDGTYGIDVGNGDEIAQIYNSGAGKDPTLVTGSWDVVFALPTNSSTGALTTGTGNAWSHPHLSNLLYTSTTNTGGFMMNGTYGNDGWNPVGTLTPSNSTGNSLSFDGSADHIRVNDNASLDFTEFTISFWVKTTETGNKVVFEKGTGEFFIFADDAACGGKWIAGGRNQTDGDRLCADNEINDNSWHHVAVSYTNSLAQLFIDGVLNDSKDPTTDTVVNNLPITIGGRSGNANLVGTIDDVRVFSRTLSQDEIKATMYKTTLSGTEDDNLVGWWKLNDASGQTVTDSSGNGNNGTLGVDANVASDDPTWSTQAPAPSISSLATSEKIYAGGYKYTSNGANQGIVRSFTATSGGDYVLRALGHSDGTCSPQVKITRADGTTEISHLNGTTSSTRTDPDVYVFTWESPAAEANQVQLLNTASNGTCHWHQVEVQSNLINNPSLETGSGDPWIPTGWTSGGGLSAGDSELESVVVHSGQASLQFNANANNSEFVYSSFAGISIDEYAMIGAFAHTAGALKTESGRSVLQSSSGIVNVDQSNGGNWQHLSGVMRSVGINNDHLWLVADSTEMFVDDAYAFELSPVSLTVTPASEANSTESTGVRVDGADKYTESITGWTATNGFVSFDFTPRHSSANMLKFLPSSDPQVFNAVFDTSNYINLVAVSDNVFRFRVRMGGTDYQTTWNHTGEFTAGTTYSIKLRYGSSSATVYLDDVAKASVTPVGGINWSGNVPNVFNFGSDGGTQVIDATFGNIVFDSTAPTISLNALDPDPTSDTTPTLTGTATEAIGTVATVHYQMDGTGGAWSACTADDGTFDEASEAFSCTSSTLADGSHTLYVRATDSNGNTTAGGSESSDAFVVDATAPSVPGTPATTSPTADTTPTWSFTASTDATAGLADPAYTLEWSQDNTFADGVSSATTNTNSFTHSTPLGDATWYVRVKATDLAGNQSAWSDSGSVQINTGAPTGTVSINAGAGFTNSRSVTLTLSASSGFFSGTSDINMKLSNLADLSDGAWEAFAASKSWTLAEGDGVKTVYVQFKDATDNESGAYTDTIVLDTLAPNEATELNPGNNHTGNAERPTFTFKPATDAASGINRYKLVVDNPGDTGFTLDSIVPERSESDTQPRYTVTYEGFGDDRSDNDRIHITTKSSTAWGLSDNDGKLAEGVVVWSIVAVDNAGNERITSHRYVLDRTNPRLSVDTLGSTPITSSYMATSDVTPTLKGTLTDPLAGVDTSQAQSEHGPKVSSGPRSVEVQIEKRSNYTYQPHLVYTLTLDESWWSCNQTVITDNTKQTCDKFAPFTFTPPQALEQGSYRVSLTGMDNALNRSTQSQLTLDIVPYTALTTAQEQAVIEETIKENIPELTPEEGEEITQELEIAIPTDAPLTREVADTGAGVITSTIEALGTAAQTIITTTTQALTTVAQATTTMIVNRVKFVASVGTSITELTSRVVSQLAQGIYADSTKQLAFIVRSVRSAYGFVAGNAPGFARSTLQAFGGRMQSIADQAQALSNTTQAQIKETANKLTTTSSEAVANASFALGERAQDVSDTVGLAIIKATYNLVTEPTTIANVQATVLSPTTVKISWDTNHPANGKVNWGFASGQYEFEAQTSKRTTNHEFTLENLEPGTNYHFEVMSQNKNYVYDANREFQTPPVQ